MSYIIYYMAYISHNTPDVFAKAHQKENSKTVDRHQAVDELDFMLKRVFGSGVKVM